jgi:hypothetical protein
MPLVVNICLCPQFEAVCLARVQRDVDGGQCIPFEADSGDVALHAKRDIAPHGSRALCRGSLLERPQNPTDPRGVLDIATRFRLPLNPTTTRRTRTCDCSSGGLVETNFMVVDSDPFISF